MLVIHLQRGKTRDKADRATTEQVMDPRTRMILFKLLSHQVFSEINGCVSTGKEANVYHAVTNCGVTVVETLNALSIEMKPH
jgi:RIO kinase 1